MKFIFIIIFLIFSNITLAKDNVINITFTKENAKYWQYISDRTMGGISDGKAALEQDGEMFFARLTGEVSTENNGGFIQLRSRFSFENFEKDSKKIKGVRLKVRGNGEIYHIFIRTNETQSYRDFYLASFKANSNWEMIDLPFNKFKHRYSTHLVLEGKKIRTIGIVAYGRDFVSDVSVSKIVFYY